MADEPVSGPPWQGRYAFEPRSIRVRDTGQSPGEIIGPAANPDHTELRTL